MKKLFLLWAATIGLGACADDNAVNWVTCPSIPIETISFESSEAMLDPAGGSVVLGDAVLVGNSTAGTHKNVYWVKSFADYANYLDTEGVYNSVLFTTANGQIKFGGYYSSTWGDYWSGFVLSANYDTTATEMSYDNQFAARTTKGACGSKVCAIGYVDTYSGGYAIPTIETTLPTKFCHCYIANTSLTYTHQPQNVETSDYYYTVVVTGWRNGSETGEVRCRLIEKGRPAEGWQFVDLLPLGTVDKITFTIDTNDANEWGITAPTYFAIDEIGVFELYITNDII